MALEITLLGDVTIRDARPQARHQGSLGSPQARVAFALLTVERHHGVTRDALADAMWPNGLPPTWASALRTVVSRVRSFVARALGQEDDELLVARGGSYLLRLPEDTVVDIELAEQQVVAAREALADDQPERAHQLASEAIARLGGPFLPDHDGEWVTAQRARLADLLVVGLEVTSRAAILLDDSSSAMAAAHEAVRQAPLRESAHRCLMAAHAATGNRAEALRAYQQLRRMLAEELGVEPDAETEAAYLDLLGPPPTSSAPRPSEGEERGALRPGMTVPFVGRESELAAVEAAWSEALASGRQVVVVTGEAGVGKTRFATTFARSVTAQGALTLFGRCDPEPTIPYQPVVEMLDPFVAATPQDEMPPLSRSAVAELAAVFPSFAGSGLATTKVDRTLLFDAVTKLVANAARDHPLLLVLDDLQWGHGDTALLVGHILRRVSQKRILVVLVARAEAALDHVLDETILALDREGVVLRIRLGGIDVPAFRSLCRAVLPEAAPDLLAMAPKLVADTTGNPFMLVELLRAHAEGVPLGELSSGPVTAGLRSLVGSRLAGVGPVVRTLLNAASACGGAFEVPVVAAVADLDEDVAVEALDVAAASGLVVEVHASQRGSYRFAQDIVRRAVYEGLSLARRRRLHSRIADTLEARRAAPHPVEVAALAHHRCAGAEPGGDVRAVRLALAAAAEAQGMGAPSEAVHWCRTALDHVAPSDAALHAEVVIELGLAEAARDPAVGGRTLFDGALRARRCGRCDLAARAALGLADMSRRRPELRQEASAVVHAVLADQQSVASSGSQLTPLVWARLLARRVELGGATTGEVTEAATAVTILRRGLADLEGPDGRADRLDLAHDLETLATVAEDAVARAAAHHHQGMVAAMVGDGTRADDAVQAMREALEVAGSPVGEVLVHERKLALAVAQGRPPEVPGPALATDQAGGPFELGGLRPGEAVTRQLVVARWLQGRAPEPDDAAYWEASAASAAFRPVEEALTALALGERGRGRLLVGELTSDPRQLLPPGDGWLHAMGELSLAVVELADPTSAMDLYELLAPYATLTCGVGYRSFVGTAAFHLGRLAALGGEWAEAERHLAEALRQLTALGAHPWIALTQHALARVLEARGRSSDLDWIAALDAEARWLASRHGLRLTAPQAER